MKLTHVQVKNFKCINDTTEFKIDDKVTCLVGKNESGKTALLQAISKLNPTDESLGKFDFLNDYPRYRMVEDQSKVVAEGADLLITTWKLEPADTEKLQSMLGPTANKMTSVKVYKGYDNAVRYGFKVEEQEVINHLLESSALSDDEKMQLKGVPNLKTLHQKIAEVKEPSAAQKKCLEAIARFEKDDVDQTVVKILHSMLPKVAYFSEYLRMPGQVSVNDLKAKQQAGKLTDEYKIFLALLAMINKTPEDLERIVQHEMMIAQLEAASNAITKEIFAYWSQNRYLKVQFRFDQGLSQDMPPFNSGWVVRTRIENLRHGVSTIFDQRSAGFVWFFSFLVWFGQVKKQFGDNVLILLDEPGLTLHAKAQADLLRYIEERLTPKYQVIYTTHSPFMIDPKNLLRSRTVEDIFIEPKEGQPPPNEMELGTKVGDDVLSTDRDTLFPLQAALGYEITQTMFVGEHTLLVEGPSDLLYIQWFKRKLASMGRTSLDDRWTIAPCGSVDKIPSFLALFAGNKLHIAVLLDVATGQKRRVKDLRETKLLRAGHVLTIDSYANQEEADIEDLLGRDVYADLVTQAYNLDQNKRIPSTRPSDAPIRVAKEVEIHFDRKGLKFDHYHPAEFMIQKGSGFSLPGLDGAVGRFEAVFRDLNALLP